MKRTTKHLLALAASMGGVLLTTLPAGAIPPTPVPLQAGLLVNSTLCTVRSWNPGLVVGSATLQQNGAGVIKSNIEFRGEIGVPYWGNVYWFEPFNGTSCPVGGITSGPLYVNNSGTIHFNIRGRAPGVTQVWVEVWGEESGHGGPYGSGLVQLAGGS